MLKVLSIVLRGKSVDLSTVCTEIIAELILERAGPVIFQTLSQELKAFRQIPVICPARRAKPENYGMR